MQKDYIAVVGCPNVGKSTLINRLTQTKDAIVHESAGVTRDRSYHETDWNGRKLVFIDTGGIEAESSKSAFNAEIRSQALAATREADAILFVVDATLGLTADDELVSKILKKSDKPILLAVNKVDNPAREDLLYDFYKLGFSSMVPLSGLHGTGTGDLLDKVTQLLEEINTNNSRGSVPKSSALSHPEHHEHKACVDDINYIDEGYQYASGSPDISLPDGDTSAGGEQSQKDVVSSEIQIGESAPLRVAIIGRPNVGKSSFINRVARQERVIVSDVAGTTRDAINIDVVHEGETFRFVDTAGLRKKAKVSEDIEYYSYVRGLAAIEEADVCLLIIDAFEGVSEQDQKIAQLALDKGAGLIVLLNKWDLLKNKEEARERCMESVVRRLDFARFAPILRISALSGRSISKIWPLIAEVAKNRSQKIPTHELNVFLATVRETGHTVIEGKQKLRMTYATQTGFNPPVITFFCNHPKIVDEGYKRFLENRLRETFNLIGTPVVLKFRTKDRMKKH